MHSLAFLAAWVGPVTDAQPPLVFVAGERFLVFGYYCRDKDCSEIPDLAMDDVVPDQAAEEALLAGAAQADTSWQVSLNCAVTKKRLASCHAIDDLRDVDVGGPIATHIASKIRITTPARERRRAYVSIQYEAEGCASWRCTATPAPPPPPPEPAASATRPAAQEGSPGSGSRPPRG